MADPPRSIHGVPLPSSLLSLMTDSRWKTPLDRNLVLRHFPECGDFQLYSPDYMEFENRHWRQWSHRHFPGEPDPENAPGDIDPHRSLLIGDLGNGWDQPLALDYRHCPENPPVLMYRWRIQGKGNRWVEIARDIDTLAAMLGL